MCTDKHMTTHPEHHYKQYTINTYTYIFTKTTYYEPTVYSQTSTAKHTRLFLTYVENNTNTYIYIRNQINQYTHAKI